LNRERVRRMLWKSPVDFVIEGPLNPTPAEEIQKDRGFWPVEYASVINNDRASCKFENRYLASLLVQMAPVYRKLELPVCRSIMEEVTPERIDGLDFETEANLIQFEYDVTPSLESAMVHEASRVERQLGIHRSQKSGDL
jgi:hypothetical protein